MSIDELYQEVSAAIYEAERLEDQNPQSTEAKTAFSKVSLLEEKIFSRGGMTVEECNIARRGAVKAAIKAGDFERANRLIMQFENVSDFPQVDKAELRLLVANPALMYTSLAASKRV